MCKTLITFVPFSCHTIFIKLINYIIFRITYFYEFDLNDSQSQAQNNLVNHTNKSSDT